MAPPKKARTRDGSAQAVPETRPQARKNKRRHSDASNTSDLPSTSQSTATPTAPKRRKHARAPEPEVIVEEEEIVTVTNDQSGPEPMDDDENGLEVLQPHPERHVRFGQAGAGAHNGNLSEDGVETSTAQHITPHPRKMTIKRRATTSPSTRVKDGSKRVKVTTSRTSLPASLAHNGQDPVYILEEHHFAPLRQVILERVHRRQTLHAGRADRLRDLELELETQSRLGNVERVQELHDNISTWRKEYKQVISDGDVKEELDDDMLVLESEEAITYPQLPEHADGSPISNGVKTNGSTSYHVDSLALFESQSTQDAWNAERRKFEDAIVALSREANEAKTELQILKIELLALGFGGQDVSIQTVLLSIRESFTRIREGVESILPGSLPDDVSNQNVIEILLANIKDFVDRLYTQDREIQQRTTLIGDLGQQVHGLVDHLAEARIRNEKLEQGWSELDQSNEEKSRRLGKAEEELEKIEEDREILENHLHDKVEKLKTVSEENDGLSKSLERLTESLQRYRDEEARLTLLITRMEEEHQATVSKMNREREDTVRELEDQIDIHTKLHQTAELLAEERQSMIIGLELRIESVEGERDALQVELQEMKLSLDAEHNARETAETELDEKAVEVQDLEGRVDKLEDQLIEMNHQLDELRLVIDTERAQRESAEKDLDDRNADVEELNHRLREQGIQANELRQKLFEVQQLNEKNVKDLEEAASARDEQYQRDIAIEVERREAADELGQQHADTIVTLEANLKSVELQMQELLSVRDERIRELEDEVTAKNGEIDTLRRDLRSVEELYETQVAESTQQRQDLEASIASLKVTITKHETYIADLGREASHTATLHDSEMDDRNAHIAQLNYRIAAFQTQITELESTKEGLERRVEDEAAQMLQSQAAKEDEIERLHATIRGKQESLVAIEQKVRETDTYWQEVLAARDVEIAQLTSSSTTTTETLQAVSADLAALKRKFSEYVRRSSGRIALLQGALADAHAVVDAECGAAEVDGEQILEELAAMADHAHGVVRSSQQTVSNTQTSSSQASTTAVKKTKGRKRRVMDSGIGMEMDGDANGY